MDDLTSSDANIQTVMLDALCEASSSAFIICDRNDLLVFASRKLLSYFSLPEQAITPGVRLRDFLGALYDCFDGGDSESTRNVGREQWVAERLSAHWKERSEQVERLGGGRWIRFLKRRMSSGYGICIVTDISEHKKREQQWRIDLERVQITEEILDSLPAPVFVKDRNRHYVAVNQAAVSMLQRPAEGILGRTIFDIHPADMAGRIDDSDKAVLETGVPVTIPECLSGPDGQQMVLVTRKHRIGKPGRYFLVTTMEDITDFTAVDRSGRCNVPGLENISFIPGSMPGGTGPGATPKSLDGLRLLFVSDDHSVRDRIDTSFAPHRTDHCVVSSSDELEAFIDIAMSSGVSIDLVLVDSRLAAGCIDLACRVHPEAMIFEPADLDDGFPEKVARHLSATAGHRPAVSASAATRPVSDSPAKDHSPSGIDVLVVEDNEINQIVFARILDALGYSYRIAPNGEDAIRLWTSLSPSLILMDTGLPDIDGLEVCRRIRRAGYEEGAQVPVVGVVARAFEGDKDVCLAAGMNDMILKPVSPDIIAAVLSQFLPERTAQLDDGNSGITVG